MNATTETGDFKKWFVFSIMAIALIVIGILSYQWIQTSYKAQAIREEARKLEKDTRESSELFGKLETIKKNENKIEQNDNENEILKTEINEISKDLPKYWIESKSKYITHE